jgi:hypothetical protein
MSKIPPSYFWTSDRIASFLRLGPNGTARGTSGPAMPSLGAFADENVAFVIRSRSLAESVRLSSSNFWPPIASVCLISGRPNDHTQYHSNQRRGD